MMSDPEYALIIADQAHIIETQADQIKKLSIELAQHLEFECEDKTYNIKGLIYTESSKRREL